MSDWDLNEADINVLMDALNVWTREEAATDLLSTMLVSLLTSDDQHPQQREAEDKVRRDKLKSQSRERQEQAVLLQAKLVHLKRQLAETHVRRMLMS